MKIDIPIIDSTVSKTSDNKLVRHSAPYLIDFAGIYALLNQAERSSIEELLTQKPQDYGINEPFRGLEQVPDELVSIEDQVVTYEDGTVIRVDTKYLPKPVYNAYTQLAEACQTDLGKKVLISSGYRSPAYQAVNFMRWLQYYGYNFKKTLGYVSIPGYSEHSLARKTAIDFMTEEGVSIFDAPPFGRFDETPEYEWLLKNAGQFKFIATCPKDNPQGFSFEPWHWQFSG